MVEALAHRGPDRRSHVAVGAAVLGQLELWTRFREANETLPWQDKAAGLTIVLDGHLDNRDEMQSLLRLANKPMASDAEIIARAYQAWGVDAPDRLVGNFAFALWDATKQTLYCARDFASTKPFYYAITNNQFVFASEIRALLTIPNIGEDVDFGFLGEVLLTSVRSQVDTVYQQIKRIRPAHWLTWHKGEIRTGCYWDFSRLQLQKSISINEAAEGVAHYHREAVSRMTTTDYPVGAHLSGGLDSSGNCVVIDEQLRAGRLLAPAAYALATLFPGFSCNEPEYIKLVADGLSFETHYFEPEWPSADEHFAQIQFHREPSPYPHFASFDSGYHGLKSLGGRVVLNGENGDELFLADPVSAAAMLWKGQPGQARQRLERLSRIKPDDSLLTLIRRCVSLGLPHESPFDLLRRIRAERWERYGLSSRRFNEHWLKRENMGLRLQATLGVKLSDNRYVNAIVGHFFKGHLSYLQETSDLATAQIGVEVRSPLMYKPLVQFCATLPPEFRDDVTSQRKRVLRESLRGRMSDEIVNRSEKVDFSDAYGDNVDRLAAAPAAKRFAANQGDFLTLPIGDGKYAYSLAVEGRVFEPGALLNVLTWLDDRAKTLKKYDTKAG